MKKVLSYDYVNNEKNLLDLEYDFIEKLSKKKKRKRNITKRIMQND